jgi:peptidylprolyl isomerase
MAQAKTGDTVQVHYTGKLDDGSVFDTSVDHEPLTFQLGAGTMIPGFEHAVLGMEPGERKTFTIPPEEAYGAYSEDLTTILDVSQFPEGADPEIGQEFEMSTPEGRTFRMTVTDINESEVTLDANHPLAGENLTFEIELVGIG